MSHYLLGYHTLSFLHLYLFPLGPTVTSIFITFTSMTHGKKLLKKLFGEVSGRTCLSNPSRLLGLELYSKLQEPCMQFYVLTGDQAYLIYLGIKSFLLMLIR